MLVRRPSLRRYKMSVFSFRLLGTDRLGPEQRDQTGIQVILGRGTGSDVYPLEQGETGGPGELSGRGNAGY